MIILAEKHNIKRKKKNRDLSAIMEFASMTEPKFIKLF